MGRWLTAWLRREGSTGIDLNPENIRAVCQRYNHDRLTFIHGDVTRDMPEGTYDTVVMSNVLEHIDDRVGLLKTVQGRLQPRRWLFRVPMINRDWLVPMKQELERPYFSDPTHCVEYTMDLFEREMAQAGLAIKSATVCWGEIWAEVYDAGHHTAADA